MDDMAGLAVVNAAISPLRCRKVRDSFGRDDKLMIDSDPLVRCHIAYERDESRKLISRIDVMFHHIEDEVIRAAKTPDREDEQKGDLQCGLLDQKKRGGESSGE